MRYLLDADDDWIELLRRFLYPLLHPLIDGVGGYAVGEVGHDQFVCATDLDEETLEEAMEGEARRNPIACFKSLPDGRKSEGSWVLLHSDVPELVEEGMQLHITLFRREAGGNGREIYAHYEDDWRTRPFDHLNEVNFDEERGVELATEYFNTYTDL